MTTVNRSAMALAVVAVLGLAACTSSGDDASGSTAGTSSAPGSPASAASSASSAQSSTATSTPAGGTLLPAPVSPVPALLDDAKVQAAVDQLDAIVGDAMQRTGVPGVATAVVYGDKVLLATGWGVRKVGEPETVDADTVFQVASVSKPVASTIIAGVVGQKKATWTDPVTTWNPDFELNDPYVTANADLQDLLSHRTGLPGTAGDLLEDLGWDREYILGVLDQEPLAPFRQTYEYSNFGITEAGVAAADAMGVSWEDLADSMLFEPLGMASSSYSHATYESRTNKAIISIPVGPLSDRTWQANPEVRIADAEAPAGGLSSSVNDMAQFLRLHLGGGTIDGTAVIDQSALVETLAPHMEINHPTDPAVRTQFYGLCWNINYDDHGRVKYDHSGAFAMGASTNVAFLPGEQLGIVTLTNAQAHGVPEAINNAFLDAAQNGRPTVDWVAYFEKAYDALYQGFDQIGADWKEPPADAAAPQALSSYVGTYQNSYYGPLTVQVDGDELSMTMGPPTAPVTFALAPFDGDAFSYQTIKENNWGRSGATFTVGADGTTGSVVLASYDLTGLGTFTRG